MGARVLLVEDDPDLRDVLARALEEEGYEVTPSDNGVDALVRLEFGRRPDVVVLDLLIPSVSGADLIELIRHDPRVATMPVVVITGAFVPAEVARAASAVLPKPFGLEQLCETLDALTSSDSSFSQLRR